MQEDNVWIRNVDVLASSLGGWDVVFDLCLSNPDANRLADLDQFHTTVKKISNDNGDIPYPKWINIPIPNCNSTTTSPRAHKNSTPSLQDDTIANIDQLQSTENLNSISQIPPIQIASTNWNINSNNTNINSSTSHKDQQVFVHDTKEYDKSLIIIETSMNNSPFFKYFPDFIAKAMLNKVILNKRFVFGWIIFGFTLGITGFIFSTIFKMIWMYYILTTPVWISCLIVGSIYLLSMNIIVCKLIFETFDFWFKVYNVLILVWSFTVLKSDSNSTAIITPQLGQAYHIFYDSLWVINAMIISLALFIVDALPISSKTKRISIGLTGIYCFGEVVYAYFYYQDYTWNPFNFEYSVISFKSIYLSSGSNISLFVLKPVLSDVIRIVKKRISDSTRGNKKSGINNSIDINDKNNYERCSSIYKRPYIKWNTIDDINITSINVNNITPAHLRSTSPSPLPV